jgi:hypothetical protein
MCEYTQFYGKFIFKNKFSVLRKNQQGIEAYAALFDPVEPKQIAPIIRRRAYERERDDYLILRQDSRKIQ